MIRSLFTIMQRHPMFGFLSLIGIDADDSPSYVVRESEPYDPRWDDVEPALFDYEAENIYEPRDAIVIPFPLDPRD